MLALERPAFAAPFDLVVPSVAKTSPRERVHREANIAKVSPNRTTQNEVRLSCAEALALQSLLRSMLSQCVGRIVQCASNGLRFTSFKPCLAQTRRSVPLKRTFLNCAVPKSQLAHVRLLYPLFDLDHCFLHYRLSVLTTLPDYTFRSIKRNALRRSET